MKYIAVVLKFDNQNDLKDLGKIVHFLIILV